ncbi:MAG: response regulator [Betaproteobacteria bacterium]|nr:response regulator [Betaproteobacteria bacterium]
MADPHPGPARVMIAEDESSILLSLEFLLRKAGFDTRVARDGEEALGVLTAFRPDVALLDVMLPRRSGLEVCRFIRAEPALAGTRILLLTAKGGRQDLQNGLAAGADEYLTKPFSTHELLERVKALAAGKGSA